MKCCLENLKKLKWVSVCWFPLWQEQEDTPTASLLNLEPTENMIEVQRSSLVFHIFKWCVYAAGTINDSRLTRLSIAGQSGDTEEDQGLAVWSGQRRGDRKPLRPSAERDSRQELCQLFRLLRKVGAAGASAPTLQRERAEQEIQYEFLIDSIFHLFLICDLMLTHHFVLFFF